MYVMYVFSFDSFIVWALLGFEIWSKCRRKFSQNKVATLKSDWYNCISSFYFSPAQVCFTIRCVLKFNGGYKINIYKQCKFDRLSKFSVPTLNENSSSLNESSFFTKKREECHSIIFCCILRTVDLNIW